MKSVHYKLLEGERILLRAVTFHKEIYFEVWKDINVPIMARIKDGFMNDIVLAVGNDYLGYEYL